MISANEFITFLLEQQYQFKVLGTREVSCCICSSLGDLKDNCITWVKKWNENNKNLISSAEVENLVIVCPETDFDDMQGKGCFICTEEPKLVFFEIIDHFFCVDVNDSRIAETARVYTDSIGENCSIGDYSTISKDTVIGNNVSIGSNVVTVGKVIIGDGCKIQSGTVIGEAGYGYYTLPNGHNKQVPHVGGVVLKHHVEVGSNTCIDRGTIGDTIVGAYSKIDNLVHIAHNVQIGEDCMVIAGAVLCGSCKLEDKSYIAPGAIIRNQITVARDTVVGMQTLITKDTQAGSIMMGVPGKRKDN